MTTYGIEDLTAYRLADLADVAAPDTLVSPGAAFLTGVRDHLAEALDWRADDPADAIKHVRDDGIHEIADSAVPVYTHARWLTFVDLAAWSEDISELADGAVATVGLTEGAGVALYIIAERLTHALLDQIVEHLDDDTDDDNTNERG